MAANQFLDPIKLGQVQTYYITQFEKVDTLETTIQNLGNTYLALAGGTVTGAVLSSFDYSGTVADNAFVTKSYVASMIPSVSGYMPTTGGQFTGDVTTINTTFTNTSFITKTYVDTNYMPKTGTTLTDSTGFTLIQNNTDASDTTFANTFIVGQNSEYGIFLTASATPNGGTASTTNFWVDTFGAFTDNQFIIADTNGSYYGGFTVADMILDDTSLRFVYEYDNSEHIFIATTYGKDNLTIKTTDGNDYTNLFTVNSTALTYTGDSFNIGHDSYGCYKIATTTTSGCTSLDVFVSDSNVGTIYTGLTLAGDEVNSDQVIKITTKQDDSGTVTNVPLYFTNPVKTAQTTFADDEFVTKSYVDNATPSIDLSGYVSVVDYNDLVAKLNDFLLETSGVEPTSNTFGISATVNTAVTVTFNQAIANGLIIDWGDGKTDSQAEGTSNVTLTHTYTDTNTYYITFTEATGGNVTIASITGATVTSANIVDIDVTAVGTGLTKVYTDNNVTASYFNGNTNLTSAIIGSDVTAIGATPFSGCTSLTRLVIKGNAVTLGGKLFASSSETIPIGFKIYVPTGTGATYKAATNWSDYATYIEEM